MTDMVNIRVLVVDDEPAVRSNVRDVMTIAGREEHLPFEFSIDESSGPGEPLEEMVSNNSYDLAVVDYRLIGGTGIDVLKAIVPTDPLRETKMVIYTGLTQNQTPDKVLEAIRLGAFTFIRKGHGTELEDELRRVLRALWLERNRAMVGNFVDKRLRDKLANPQIMSRLREGCVVEKGIFFCDISDSTQFVKDLQTPMAGKPMVGPVLRELLSWIGDVIQKHGGIVDKFIGDEVMAYFGDSMDERRPSKAEAAETCRAMVEASLEIRRDFRSQVQKVLEMLRVRVQHRPKKTPWVKCVINYDTVVWGVLGSDKYLDLTILTDGVVTAARVMQHKEGREKLLNGGDIYVLSSVRETLREGELEDHFDLEKTRPIDLRNFNEQQVEVSKVNGWGPRPKTAI